VTNGVTPRRFIAVSNPSLARLITGSIGERWMTDLQELQKLEPFAGDAAFRAETARIKRANKERLADHIQRATGHPIDPDTLFDVQVKRIHEYKRQLLNVLHILTLYQRILAGTMPEARRTFVFAGKAAPSYFLAKLIIRLINDVGDVVRRHPEASKWLAVVFVPDFNVKVAERIYPAADLSEQISLAGKEASGTGNMKLAMNGALTIGTLDGANVEIREQVGAELFYLFGLTADEAYAVQHDGYRPSDVARRDPELNSVLELIASGQLAHGHAERYAPLVRSLLDHDEYLVLADYRAYITAQERVSHDFGDRDAWTRRTIETIARMGHFSSDRSIDDYCRRIWHVSRVSIAPPASESTASSAAEARGTKPA
jgi:starch phosphorylase